ncbi:late control gene D protein (GPD), partial [Paraburkholderia bryophila]
NAKGKRKSVVIGGENNKNMKVLPEDYATEAEARAAAQAEYDRTQRSQATFDYTLARARPDAFPEMPVTVSGFKPEIDATPWLVKKATHTINDSGFETVLEMEMRESDHRPAPLTFSQGQQVNVVTKTGCIRLFV